jgi:hypothetical protein
MSSSSPAAAAHSPIAPRVLTEPTKSPSVEQQHPAAPRNPFDDIAPSLSTVSTNSNSTTPRTTRTVGSSPSDGAAVQEPPLTTPDRNVSSPMPAPPPHTPATYNVARQLQPQMAAAAEPDHFLEDDDHTEPSSAANTTGSHYTNPASSGGASVISDNAARQQLVNQSPPTEYTVPLSSGVTFTSTFSRFIDQARKRLSGSEDVLAANNNRGKELEDDDEARLPHNALIAGYLQKLGRNGKWQLRWFETDGECLSYYKSAKRTKLLATLDLEKVRTRRYW